MSILSNEVYWAFFISLHSKFFIIFDIRYLIHRKLTRNYCSAFSMNVVTSPSFRPAQFYSCGIRFDIFREIRFKVLVATWMS